MLDLNSTGAPNDPERPQRSQARMGTGSHHPRRGRGAHRGDSPGRPGLVLESDHPDSPPPIHSWHIDPDNPDGETRTVA